jgi:hypothetical protein
MEHLLKYRKIVIKNKNKLWIRFLKWRSVAILWFKFKLFWIANLIETNNDAVNHLGANVEASIEFSIILPSINPCGYRCHQWSWWTTKINISGPATTGFQVANALFVFAYSFCFNWTFRPDYPKLGWLSVQSNLSLRPSHSIKGTKQQYGLFLWVFLLLLFMVCLHPLSLTQGWSGKDFFIDDRHAV